MMLNGFVFGDRGLGASGDTHPLWILGHALADPYLVLGASAVGQIHLARGLPRDDAFMVRSLGPWLAIGVADGVGSRPLSRYGATYAVEALTALLLRPFAVPLSDLRTSHSGSAAAPATLAPPAMIEDVELKWPFAEKERGDVRASPLDWVPELLRKLIRTDPVPAEPAPATPDALQQGASVGWWLSTAESATLSEPSAQTPTATPLPRPPTGPLRGPFTDDNPVPTATTSRPLPPPGSVKFSAIPDEPDLRSVMHQAFEKTHMGLRGHAQGLGVELSDLGCTALALLLNRETGYYAVGQVGDGAILGLTARGEVKELVDAPDPGDGQATYTLNRPNFQNYLVVQVQQPAPANPFVAFYVMTDGLSGDLLFSAQQDALSKWAQDVARNLRQAASPAQAAAGMLNWLATYQVKGSWDDRTLVVVTQREPNDDNRYPTGGQSGPI